MALLVPMLALAAVGAAVPGGAPVPIVSAVVPAFSWRCRLAALSPTASAPGTAPPDSLLTTWTLGGIDVRSNGSAWSATGKFTGKGTMLADSTPIPSAVIAPMTVRSSPSAVGSDGMIWMIVVEVQLPTGQRLSLNAKLYGARLENCQKNIGKPRYAFNAFQQRMLPHVYRPPVAVAGKASS